MWIDRGNSSDGMNCSVETGGGDRDQFVPCRSLKQMVKNSAYRHVLVRQNRQEVLVSAVLDEVILTTL